MRTILLLICGCWMGLASAGAAGISGEQLYLIGAGSADITGPASGLGMLGYAYKKQKTAGIHQRLRARAFVIEKDQKLATVVTIDTCFVEHEMKQDVLERLQNEVDSRFDDANILIQATHNHSGPGAYTRTSLHHFGTPGYSRDSFVAIRDGIYEAIERAYGNRVSGRISFAKGRLEGASRNRSRKAYQLNPLKERLQYDSDLDLEMALLKFQTSDGQDIGNVNWFPVHVTSVDKRNRLISAGNKGYASYLWEMQRGSKYQGRGEFVAAFANANGGDSSPNTAGNVDQDPEWECAAADNLACQNESAVLHLNKAKELSQGARIGLDGELDARIKYIDMHQEEIFPPFNEGQEDARTCSGSIGISLIAGAEDGRGPGTEGQRCDGPWFPGKTALCLNGDPCQKNKPIVRRTGEQIPLGTRRFLPIQLLKIGSVVLVALPGEFTTMAGRRIRRSVQKALAGSDMTEVVLAGYANAHSGYVTTRQEYSSQQYEGASTYHGPWTLAAYQQGFYKLAKALATGQAVELGPSEILPGEVHKQITFPLDSTGVLKWGKVIKEPHERVKAGTAVTVSFVTAQLNTMRGKSFATVESKLDGRWRPVIEDWHKDTFLFWKQKALNNLINVMWKVPKNQALGTYRIRHRGAAQIERGQWTPFEGVSREFQIVADADVSLRP
jgi:neutral ceramidase